MLGAAVATAYGTNARADENMIELGNKQIFHKSFGSGEPILVLHGGLGLDHSYFLPALEAWGEFATVHLYDHEGNGRSSAPDDYASITLDTMADDVFAVADALGLETFVLYGHSYGGFIAQIAALKHPERLKGLILASTCAKLGYWADFPDWAPPEAQAAVDKLFSEPMSDDKVWSETWLAAFWRDPDPEKLAAVHAATVYKSAAVRNSNALLQDFNVLDELANLEVPTLLLAGRDDFITPVEAHEDMDAKLPNSTLIMFEESGHLPFITEAEDYTAAVRDWVSGL